MYEYETVRGTTLTYRLLGALVSLCGLVADTSVGLAILRGAAPAILLLHPIAVLIWAEGLCTLGGRSLWSEARGILATIQWWRLARSETAGTAEIGDWDARAAAMALIGLLLFPGFGPAGCMIAFGLTALPFIVPWQRPAPAIEPDPVAVAMPPHEAVNPLLDLSVQPIVDVVRGADAVQKRAAIRLLGQQFDHESVRLLRSLLTDPDVDVRSEASVTLFRFEDLATRRVNEATTRVQDAPTAAHYGALAESYCRAVRLELLDESSAQYYLSQACDAYTRAATLAPDSTAYWIMLAQTQHERGDLNAALHALDEARARAPEHAVALALRMQIAFTERRWDLLVVPPSSIADGTEESASAVQLLRWWAGDTAVETLLPFEGTV